jgi:hypothetical protein
MIKNKSENVNLKNSIYTLIKVASNQLESIKKECKVNQIQSAEEIDVSIKHYISNMRSTLEYLSDQIFNDNNLQHKNKNTKTYFPLYCTTPDCFKSNMSNWLPNLDNKNPNLYSKLEKIQFYHAPDEREWMKDLNELDNEFKHRDFPEQQLVTFESVSIGTQDLSNAFGMKKRKDTKGLFISVNNVVLDTTVDDVMILDGKTTIINKKSANIIYAQTKNNELFFTKLQKSVIQTLESIQIGVNFLIKEFEK